MKKKALIALLVVLILGFLTQIIAFAQIPTTPPALDSTNQQTCPDPVTVQIPDQVPCAALPAPVGCHWEEVCIHDPHGGVECYCELKCEDPVPPWWW